MKCILFQNRWTRHQQTKRQRSAPGGRGAYLVILLQADGGVRSAPMACHSGDFVCIFWHADHISNRGHDNCKLLNSSPSYAGKATILWERGFNDWFGWED